MLACMNPVSFDDRLILETVGSHNGKEAFGNDIKPIQSYMLEYRDTHTHTHTHTHTYIYIYVYRQ